MLTLGVVFIVIRPSYERTVIEERTTIVQQVQRYAVQGSDEKFRTWTDITRYLAYQAEFQPGELDIAMRQNIALRPSIIQIVITSPDVDDELAVTNSDYPGFSFLPPPEDWKPYNADSTVFVQLQYDSSRSLLLFFSLKEFTAGGKRFAVVTAANAAEVADAFRSFPVEGAFGSILRTGSRIVYRNSDAFDTTAFRSVSNVSLLRTITLNGTDWIVLTAEFSSIPSASTILIPEELFLHPVRRLLTYSALLIVGLMAVVAVLGWIVSYQISKPVTQLVKEVEQLSTLDFSKPISPIRLSDLAKIGTTIESMRLALERYQRINVEKIIFEEWKNRFFLSHSQDMIALANPDGTLMFTNDRFSVFRTELAQVAPFRTKEDLLEHSSVHRSRESSSEETSGSFHIRITQMELRIDHDHKHPQFFRYHDVTIMRGEENLGSLLTLHDLTNERLIDQMKTDMMNMIAHELRNPLNSVIGFASLILEEESIAKDEIDRYLTIIQNSGKTMNQLITRFLDVQRLESGTAEYPKERTDIVEMTEMLCLAQKPMLKSKSLEVRLTKEENIPAVFASHDLMREAILNLISNAIKYGDEHRTIEVDLRRDDENVILAITDHGFGISAEDQEKLFSKFFRVTSNKKAALQVGTGLGLAHVKEVMRYHGGSVALESNAEIGCRFTLTIPIGRN